MKKQVFSVLRLLNPPQSIYQHLSFKGPFRVNIGRGFHINHFGYELENDLFWKGLDKWESASLNLWIRLARKSSTVLDVGANTGIYSLIASAVHPEARIFAFEPLKAIYHRLQANLQLNDFNIKAFDLAVSNKTGSTSFFTTNADFSYSSSLNKDHQSYVNVVEQKVNTITLDQFIKEHKLVPDLVKIDVERHEPEAIEGFMESILKWHPSLLIEVLDDAIGEKLMLLLKDTKYQYYSIDETQKKITRMQEMGKSAEYNVFLCTAATAEELGLP